VARPKRVWISEIRFPQHIADKLRIKHGVEPHEVEESARFYGYAQARWHEHPQYGLRLLVVGETYAGHRIFSILRPLDADFTTFECRTARRLNK
jgi:hypothetical protein